MDFISSFKVNATLVSNEFIDTYMASANGEYIKEYLFLLRHEGEDVTVSMIADAVNHTESDVTRALSYWKKAGVLEESADNREALLNGVFSEAYGGVQSSYGCVDGADKGSAAGSAVSVVPDIAEKRTAAVTAPVIAPVAAPALVPETASAQSLVKKAEPRPVYSPEQISSLAGDEDFSQLLYIAQKYMNKVFTQRECEVFAYLYDGLHMTAELLEYVVEYCVQGGHTSIRYIETVAINWHESGLKTVEDAKAYASSFTRDSFAVMKAFGLNDRKPGDTEREMIDRWFKTYGFTRELVLDACNRTLEATHSPSFKYADKILSGWKKAGVRSLEDVKRLDEQHAGRAKGKGSVSGTGAPEYRAGGAGRGRNSNQFQNFPQREIDYDALVLQQLTEK